MKRQPLDSRPTCCSPQAHSWHPDAHAALYFATIALASPQSTVGLEYVETLPPPDAPQMHCVWAHTVGYASVRVLVGEVLERIGGHSQAINWAQADLQVRLRRKISFGVQFTLLVLTDCRRESIRMRQQRHARLGS